MNYMYDIIIIGAGSGGLNIASFINNVGLKVLLIDKSDESIGGDCLNTGCVPSKALIHVARKFKDIKKAGEFGLSVDGEADLSKVMTYVKSTQDVIRVHENAEYFRSKGMEVVLGTASFVSKDSVQVDGVVYNGKKIIVATGSRPRELSIFGTEEVINSGRLYTNENIFSMKVLPKKLLVIGAGPIGIELGQAFRYLGSEVTVVTNDAKILPREDSVVANVLFERLKQDGINFLFNKNTERFENGNTLVIKDKETDESEGVYFDAVLVSIGRVLNTETLNLEKAGVEVDDKGRIKVDNYLQTTNKNILLCGDVVGQHQFTHAAEIHAGLIIRNFLTPFIKKELSTDAISWVTYTSPELATYGLGEVELKKRNIKYEVLESSFIDDDRAITDEARYGYAKMFVDTNTKKILGGTMVAPNAGELIQELILATQSGLTINDIFNKTYPYPTAGRINKNLVAKFQKKRLTPSIKKLMRWLYRVGW